MAGRNGIVQKVVSRSGVRLVGDPNATEQSANYDHILVHGGEMRCLPIVVPNRGAFKHAVKTHLPLIDEKTPEGRKQHELFRTLKKEIHGIILSAVREDGEISGSSVTRIMISIHSIKGEAGKLIKSLSPEGLVNLVRAYEAELDVKAELMTDHARILGAVASLMGNINTPHTVVVFDDAELNAKLEEARAQQDAASADDAIRTYAGYFGGCRVGG